MGAREKLNGAFFNGALFLAGVAGLLTRSWAVFLLTFIVAIVLACCGDDIRPTAGGGRCGGKGHGGRHFPGRRRGQW
jgi:hypothetical protein